MLNQRRAIAGSVMGVHRLTSAITASSIHAQKLADICTGYKRALACSGEDHARDVRTLWRIGTKQMLQLQHGSRVERVEGFFPIDRNDQDVVFFFQKEMLVLHDKYFISSPFSA